MSDLSKDHLRPHCDTYVCSRCRRPIEKGDRIQQVYISLGEGRNPTNIMERGLILSDEWEMVHVDCNDPLLVKGLGHG